MQAVLPIAFIAALVAVVIWVIRLALVQEKQRTSDLEKLAAELGLPFTASPGTSTPVGFEAFRLFGQGSGKKTKNLIEGEADGTRLTILDYSYVVGSGKHRHTVSQTIVAITATDLALPSFSIRPEHLFHRVGKWFGMQDINFESHPVFSKAFMLEGEQVEAVRKVLRKEVLSWLESRTGIACEAAGARLLLYRSGRRVPVVAIKQLMSEGYELYGFLRTNEGSGAEESANA